MYGVERMLEMSLTGGGDGCDYLGVTVVLWGGGGGGSWIVAVGTVTSAADVPSPQIPLPVLSSSRSRRQRSPARPEPAPYAGGLRSATNHRRRRRHRESADSLDCVRSGRRGVAPAGSAEISPVRPAVSQPAGGAACGQGQPASAPSCCRRGPAGPRCANDPLRRTGP